MGYPAATGRETLRTDVTRTRDLAPTAFRRRDSSGISQRQKAVGSSSRSTGMGRLMFYASCGRGVGYGASGEWMEGWSRLLSNTGRCALTASRKNGSPAPAIFSLTPQLYHQSRASLRCANPRTGKNQLSVSRGPKFSNKRGGELTSSPAG